jgi:hypothetical protein
MDKKAEQEIQEIKTKLKDYFTDPLFTFDQPTHIYRYDDKIIYGATSFLERFVTPFEMEMQANKQAIKLNVPVEEIIEKWDNIRDRACDLGHMVHEYIENFYEQNSTELTDDPEANERIVKFHSIYEDKLKPMINIGSEIKMFSKIWPLAGTMDQLYYYEGSVIVGDWKTNKKIKTDDDFCFRKYLKQPFHRYKENEINKYSLQISLYRLFLEEAGIHTDYGFICHIPNDGEAAIYKLKDFRAELKTYLNHEFLFENINEEEIIKITEISKLW